MLCQSWKLRTDLNAVSLSSVLDAVKNADSHAYVVEMPLKNPHAHLFLRTTTLPATLRSRLRKLGLSGNQSYSLVKIPEEYPIEYLAYMLKEQDWIKAQQYLNIPDEILSKTKEYQKAVKADMKKTKESKKKVWEHILDSLPHPNTSDYVAIASAVIDYHKEKKLIVRTFQLKAYADTIWLQLRPEDAKNHFLNEILKK